jgi:hypothetical protein
MVGTITVQFKNPYNGDSTLVVSAMTTEEGYQNVICAMLAELDDDEQMPDYMQTFKDRWDPENLIITYQPYQTVSEALKKVRS